jgi:uncharacterized membrane protein YgcG
MARLRPCTACSRHVRITDGECPFCGVANESAKTAPVDLGKPLSRAAVVFFGATALAACTGGPNDPTSSSSSSSGNSSGGGNTSSSSGTSGSGTSSGTNPEPDPDPMPQPAYGVPPIDLDAGDQ